jgi:hypothetical protein
MTERVVISNDNTSVSCSREENIQPLWRTHEADIVTRVASSERQNDDFALFALIIIYRGINGLSACFTKFSSLPIVDRRRALLFIFDVPGNKSPARVRSRESASLK